MAVLLVYRGRGGAGSRRGLWGWARAVGGGGSRRGGGLHWRGVAVALVLLGSVVAVLVNAPAALAQSTVPDAPTAVAAYSIESQMLEVRWSSSDSSITMFKVQWKSGSEEFDSSRQVSADPATSIESVQSTSAGDRYKVVLTGLTDGTEYTVRVIAENSSGDSDPSGEATGTPQSTPGQAREFWENEVIKIFEGSRPWLRETWDHITAENALVFFAEASGVAQVRCSTNRPTAPKLPHTPTEKRFLRLTRSCKRGPAVVGTPASVQVFDRPLPLLARPRQSRKTIMVARLPSRTD